MTSNLEKPLAFLRNTFQQPSILCVGLIGMALTTFASAVTAENEVKEERWFEVEVVLFKMTSEDGLFAESWKDDANLTFSEDVIDFLQPFEIIEAPTELLFEMEKENIPEAATSIDTINPETTEETAHPTLEESNEATEVAFVKLADDLLQLTAEANAIKRQSRYQLLEHFSWRQPVDSRRNATKIRIAGGFDYKDTFEYGGEKKIEFNLPDELETETDASLTENLDTPTQNIEVLENETSPESVQKDELMETFDSPTNNEIAIEPKALDWVPEIDGEIKIYIHRNYLHVDTNLVYRKPVEVPVDIYHLDEQPLVYHYDLGKQSLELENTTNNNLFDINAPLDTPMENAVTANNEFQNSNSNGFDWQFDSDFLDKKAEKLFTEKLFNYPLIQERRVRSGELHYFDHPLIGMLVMIRPYEIEVFEDELIEVDSQQTSE